ncbi:MAG: DUF4249 domain-containing protein [Bacteroidales bacterium]|jgi:hypothetical protein|nr:DUF4249 domain-containing protein [Bacteroidales bacterium]
MKYRSIKYFLLLIFLLTGSGCEKYINYVNSPEFEQKLVVTSFISPSDTLSKVFVTSNQRLYEFHGEMEDPGVITGTISDGTTEIELKSTSSGLSFSRDKMPVISGKTYTLKVYSSKGLYAEAKATVPQKREILIKVDSVTKDMYDYMPGNELVVNIELTDYQGERNYYNIIGNYVAYSSKSISVPKNDFYFPMYWFEYIDDKRASPDNKIKLDAWIIPSISDSDSAFINLKILNTEDSYYLYHTSLKQFDYGDNPFSEAKPVYSNIEGGLGIFTSYTLDSLRFRLK